MGKLLKNTNKLVAKFVEDELINCETSTIYFDNSYDFIFYKDKYITLNKKSCFELIIGIEEEFKEEGKKVINDIHNSNFVEFKEKFDDYLNKTNNKLLVNIGQKEKYKHITPQDLYNDLLSHNLDKLVEFSNNKFIIKDKKDFKALLNILNDYYTKSMDNKSVYGGNGKTKIST